MSIRTGAGAGAGAARTALEGRYEAFEQEVDSIFRTKRITRKKVVGLTRALLEKHGLAISGLNYPRCASRDGRESFCLRAGELSHDAFFRRGRLGRYTLQANVITRIKELGRFLIDGCPSTLAEPLPFILESREETITSSLQKWVDETTDPLERSDRTAALTRILECYRTGSPVLDLSDLSNLTSLPKALELMDNVEDLQISANRFTKFPAVLMNMSHLRRLDLGESMIELPMADSRFLSLLQRLETFNI